MGMSLLANLVDSSAGDALRAGNGIGAHLLREFGRNLKTKEMCKTLSGDPDEEVVFVCEWDLFDYSIAVKVPRWTLEADLDESGYIPNVLVFDLIEPTPKLKNGPVERTRIYESIPRNTTEIIIKSENKFKLVYNSDPGAIVAPDVPESWFVLTATKSNFKLLPSVKATADVIAGIHGQIEKAFNAGRNAEASALDQIAKYLKSCAPEMFEDPIDSAGYSVFYFEPETDSDLFARPSGLANLYEIRIGNALINEAHTLSKHWRINLMMIGSFDSIEEGNIEVRALKKASNQTLDCECAILMGGKYSIKRYFHDGPPIIADNIIVENHCDASITGLYFSDDGFGFVGREHSRYVEFQSEPVKWEVVKEHIVMKLSACGQKADEPESISEVPSV